jgi:hypothetical protein
MTVFAKILQGPLSPGIKNVPSKKSISFIIQRSLKEGDTYCESQSLQIKMC